MTSRIRPPPYVVDVALSGYLGAARVILEVRTFAVSGAFDILRISQCFEAAAACGMFSTHATATTVPIERISFGQPDPGTVRGVWTVTGLAAGAYRVLLNMLDAAHHGATPLAFVHLHSVDSDRDKLDWERVMDCPYPAAPPAVPFDLNVRRRLEDSADPLLRIEFERALMPEDADSLAARFMAWDGLIVRGGYLEELDDAVPDIEASLSSSQTYLAAPDTVEHLLYEFVGAREAYDAVINMVLLLHLKMGAVAALEFE
jgi:hypothetical protein